MATVVEIFLVVLGIFFWNYTAIGSSVTRFNLNFSKVSNVRLRGSSLIEVEGVGSPVRCSVLCTGTESCRSFNYGGTEKYCQLNRGTKNTNQWEAVTDYSYYEMDALNTESRTKARYTKEPTSTKSTTTSLTSNGPSTEKLTSTKEPITSQTPSTRNPPSKEPTTEEQTSIKERITNKEPITSQTPSTRNPSSNEPTTEEQTSSKERITNKEPITSQTPSTRNPPSKEPTTGEQTSSMERITSKEPITSQTPFTMNPPSKEPTTEEQTSIKERITSKEPNPTSKEPTTEEQTSIKERITSKVPSTDTPTTSPLSETVHSTCSALRDDGYTTDGYYMIDPDGPEDDPAFLVYCKMTTVGITVVDNTLSNQMITVPVDDDPYEIDIEYYASEEQILALIGQSTRCYQFLLARCRNTKLWDGSTQLSWWVSREGDRMRNWGGAPTATEGCSCQLTQECSGGSTSLCNCGGVVDEWSTDQGLLLDKDRLPVLALYFKNTATSGELLFKIGSLECM